MNGFLPVLALIFITLKLLEIITWSWWLVLLPVYFIPLLLLSSVIGAAITFIVLLYKKEAK
jgi:hypothetical protein